MPGRPKTLRPYRVAINLSKEQGERLERIALALGQSPAVSAGIFMVLGLNALETMMGMGEMVKQISSMMEQNAVTVVDDMRVAGGVALEVEQEKK